MLRTLMENSPPPPARKAWPIKWIVLAILAYVVGYTFINIAYRKPSGSAHEPYAEARQRELRTVQTTMHGWTRLTCSFTEALSTPEPAAVSAEPLPQPLDQHLPRELPMIMPGEPALHPANVTLHAPARLSASEALRLRLEFPETASVPAFGEVLAYAKENRLYVFIQDQRHVARDAQPTPAASPLAIELPPAALTPGTWQATAFTASQALTWSFTLE